VEAQQLACGQAVVKSKVLGQESDAGTRQSIAKRLTQHTPVAAVGMHQAEEHLDRGGFAGAVRAEKSEDFTSAHRQREIRHGQGRPEPLAESPRVDDEIAHRSDSAILRLSADDRPGASSPNTIPSPDQSRSVENLEFPFGNRLERSIDTPG